MNAVTLEQVLRLAEQLNAEDRAALLQHLQAMLLPESDSPPTRETLLAEFEQLRAIGAFDTARSLRNQYAEPPLELSDEELRASIHDLSTQWEQDLGHFFEDI